MYFSNFLNIMELLFQGVGYTVIVTLTCCITGMLVGLTVVILRRLSLPGIGIFLNMFTFIFRGIPVLVLVFIVYFGLPGIGIKIEPLVAMNLSLGVIAVAYLSEVFRGALESIDPSEILAAKAMGMSSLQILFLIEFPQMLRFSFPGMINEFTSVLKSSPFAYTVGIPEITRQAMALTSTTMWGVKIYIAVGVLYFFIYKTSLTIMKLVARNFSIDK